MRESVKEKKAQKRYDEEFKRQAVELVIHSQVLVQMKASSICGSDIRAIYRAHIGKGPEGYQPVSGQHDPFHICRFN
jgi:threonine dehydrogenase-like Zn-dependent dehydrogenase